MKPTTVAVALASVLLVALATLHSFAGDAIADDSPPTHASQPDEAQRSPSRNPALSRADEGYLMEMRNQIRGEQAAGQSRGDQSQWLNDPQAFREGLQQAASAQQDSLPNYYEYVRPQLLQQAAATRAGTANHRQPLPPPAQAGWNPEHGQPPRWRVLIDAAGRLDQISHSLDMRELWDEADLVRTASQELRKRARAIASEGHADPHSSDPHSSEHHSSEHHPTVHHPIGAEVHE